MYHIINVLSAFERLTMIKINPAPVSNDSEKEMLDRINGLAKPIGGLGGLETLAIKIAGIENTADIKIAKRCCLLFAGDHGVVAEGVSATPKEVTYMQSINAVKRTNTVGVLTKLNHCDLKVTDVGVDYDFDPKDGVIDKKVAYGTNDFVNEDAMTREQAEQAIQAGMDVAKQAIDEGNDILLIGELGIANTSSASAIIAAALNLPADKVVGRGSIISDKRLLHKRDIVQLGLDNRQPNFEDGLDILSKVGGYELGALAGAIIQAANSGVPLILDGFLTYAACILTQKFIPDIGAHVVASHASREYGTSVALHSLGLESDFNLDLAVGEGSGAALLLPWLDAIDSLLNNMTTLKEMQVEFTK